MTSYFDKHGHAKERGKNKRREPRPVRDWGPETYLLIAHGLIDSGDQREVFDFRDQTGTPYRFTRDEVVSWWDRRDRERREREAQIVRVIERIKTLPNVHTGLRPAVYFLMDGDEIVYVGKSRHLERRLREHRKQHKRRFTHHCAMETTSGEDAEKLEAMILQRVTTRYNRARPLLVLL